MYAHYIHRSSLRSGKPTIVAVRAFRGARSDNASGARTQRAEPAHVATHSLNP